MKLTQLQLENFRSYKKYSFDFPEDKRVTILVGSNGKGKTNFLEAIYLLALGRSFRTLQRDDLVLWGEDYYRCKGKVTYSDEDNELEVFYSSNPVKRNFKKNGTNLKNTEYIGNLLVVLFHPEDLNMLYLSPQYRRRYMDILLSQTDKKYLYALTKYKKLIKQRNALLHEIRNIRFKGGQTTELEADLDAWDEQVVQEGKYIFEQRNTLIDYLSGNIEEIYQRISGNKEKVGIRYKSKLKESHQYKEELKLLRQKDIRDAKTNLGPHLDDIEFFIDEKEIVRAASRGEFRTLLLAIKIAEITYIKEKTERNPILLLDDVFSELDVDRRHHLFDAIEGCQTIITTTEVEIFPDTKGKPLPARLVRIE